VSVVASESAPQLAAIALLALARSPSPSPSILQAPPSGPVQTAAAVIAIVFALVAGFLGYRVIRGGRGL
jgi:hypothetical protein